MQSRAFTQLHFESNRESHDCRMFWFQPLIITEGRKRTNDIDIVAHDDVVLQRVDSAACGYVDASQVLCNRVL